MTNLDYSEFLGRIAIARVFQGTLRRGDLVGICQTRRHAANHAHHQAFQLPRTRTRRSRRTSPPATSWPSPASRASRSAKPSPTPNTPVPLEPLTIDEPTLAMIFTVNTSPLSGREGQWLTSRDLRDRLAKELLTNVSIRVENTDTPEAFRVLGRGELQLAILIETMRREGYELMVGKPEIVVRTEGGKRLEPLEMLVVDCPETYIGIIMESLGTRRGEMVQMVNHGSGRVRMEFRIPSRGLIGLRGQLMTDTRGTALIHSILDGWTDYGGEMASRQTGALVADRAGVSTAFALWNLQERGELFIGAGRGSLRGHDRRRQRARSRHGREHHQGKEADQHAGVQRRRGHSPDSRTAN